MIPRFPCQFDRDARRLYEDVKRAEPEVMRPDCSLRMGFPEPLARDPSIAKTPRLSRMRTWVRVLLKPNYHIQFFLGLSFEQSAMPPFQCECATNHLVMHG